MSKITCFRHPKYDGQSSPDLSCKVCCTLFIEQVTATQETIRQSAARKALDFVLRKKVKVRRDTTVTNGGAISVVTLDD